LLGLVPLCHLAELLLITTDRNPHHFTTGVGCPCTVQNSFTGSFSHTVWDLRVTRKSGLRPNSSGYGFLADIISACWRHEAEEHRQRSSSGTVTLVMQRVPEGGSIA
ncbi:hypothetical protein JZ751_028846, partial [Albula glossodonta]